MFTIFGRMTLKSYPVWGVTVTCETERWHEELTLELPIIIT